MDFCQPFLKVATWVKYGYVLASTGIVAGSHNDAFNLKPHLQSAFKWIKRQGLSIQGSYVNIDSAFDTKEARKVCFNHKLLPNISENKRNRKRAKPGLNACSIRMSTPASRTLYWRSLFSLYSCSALGLILAGLGLWRFAQRQTKM
jgi:hypothetical protein